MKVYWFIAILGLGILFSCNDGEVFYSPKPRCYPKVVLPKKSYIPFTESYCDFTFDYPSYAKIEQDEKFFDDKTKHPCWFDIVVPDLNGRIHCSYVELGANKEDTFEKMMADAFKLADEHIVKADYIDQYPVKRENGVSGMIFEIDGPAASPFQFFLTDSTKHFLRGSVYIHSRAEPDSLRPIIEFLKEDAAQLVSTLEWK